MKVIIPVTVATAIVSLIVTVYVIKSGYSCSNMRKDARQVAKAELVIESAYKITDDKDSSDTNSVLYINKPARTVQVPSNSILSSGSSAAGQSMPNEGYISQAKEIKEKSTSSEALNMRAGSKPQEGSSGYVSCTELMLTKNEIEGFTNSNSQTRAIHETPKSVGEGEKFNFNMHHLGSVKSFPEYVTLAQVSGLANGKLESVSQVDKVGIENKESSLPLAPLGYVPHNEVIKNHNKMEEKLCDDSHSGNVKEIPECINESMNMSSSDNLSDVPQTLDVTRLGLYTPLAQVKVMKENNELEPQCDNFDGKAAGLSRGYVPYNELLRKT